MYCCLLAAILLACPVVANAAINVGSVVSFTWQAGRAHHPQAGQFAVTPNSSSSIEIYTFCLERTETLALGLGSDYYVYNISYNAHKGGGVAAGATAPGPSDPISQGTSYLYQLFHYVGTANTGLDDLTGYAVTDTPWNTALQNMFWYLEDEMTLAAASATATTEFNFLTGLLTSQFTDLATAKLDMSGGRVAVMNISPGASAPLLGPNGLPNSVAQSQLIFDRRLGPEGFPDPVPEPASLAAWAGLSVLGMAFLRRRKRNV